MYNTLQNVSNSFSIVNRMHYIIIIYFGFGLKYDVIVQYTILT